MARKQPDTPWSQPDYPALWQTTLRFIQSAYRVQLGTSKSARHFTGGPPRHRGAKCSKCSRPLALFWDLDLTDPLFDDLIRKRLSPATRLPLYFCWQCFGVSYAVSSDNSIKVHADDRQLDLLEEFESPLGEFPKERPRLPLKVQKIPSIDEALLQMEQELSMDSLDVEATRRLSSFFGEQINLRWNMQLSQLGGLPKVSQGRQLLPCPSSKCPASDREQTPAIAQMKELAVLMGDVDEGLKEAYFDVHYTICPICMSIRAQYGCD
jgi:hypothetical protein